MNFLGMGGPEFLVLLVIALIIAGPKRMVQWLYILGRWLAKLRAIWDEAVLALQRELNESGVDVEIPRELPTRATLNRMAMDALKPLSDPLKDVAQEVQKTGDEIKGAAREVQSASNTLVSEAAKPKFGNLTTAMPNAQAPKAPITGFGTWGEVPPPTDAPPADADPTTPNPQQ